MSERAGSRSFSLPALEGEFRGRLKRQGRRPPTRWLSIWRAAEDKETHDCLRVLWNVLRRDLGRLGQAYRRLASRCLRSVARWPFARGRTTRFPLKPAACRWTKRVPPLACCPSSPVRIAMNVRFAISRSMLTSARLLPTACSRRREQACQASRAPSCPVQ